MALPLHRSFKPRVEAKPTDGNHVLDIPLVVGMICMLLGVIYGYVLEWGPVIWGLIGLVGGTLLVLPLVYVLMRKHMRKLGSETELILMVNCSNSLRPAVEQIIESFCPLGLAVLERPDPPAGL